MSPKTDRLNQVPSWEFRNRRKSFTPRQLARILWDFAYLCWANLGSVDLPPRPPETKEVIESKLIPCERCGTVVAMLIFAPNATDAGHFEDYARKMYAHYNHLNVPTWIISPAFKLWSGHRDGFDCPTVEP